MDIAKYIGQYLLKNNFCYIHGLGNLEIKKKPASYDGGALQPGAFEVIISTKGSIDDGVANFIATNEQISISKAANALREFSTQARTDLQEGKEVIIPALGKFTEHNGKIGFITDPHLQYTPPSIPTIKSAPHVAEEQKISYTPKATKTSSGASINWKPVLLIVFVIAVVAIVAFFGIEYITNRNEQVAEEASVALPQDTVIPAPVVVDTTATSVDTVATTAAAVSMQNGMLSFKVIVNSFKDSTKAAKRAEKLTSYGNKVAVEMKDSAWHVVVPITAAPADTAHILDSLKRTFNPKGVSILQ